MPKGIPKLGRPQRCWSDSPAGGFFILVSEQTELIPCSVFTIVKNMLVSSFHVNQFSVNQIGLRHYSDLKSRMAREEAAQLAALVQEEAERLVSLTNTNTKLYKIQNIPSCKRWHDL